MTFLCRQARAKRADAARRRTALLRAAVAAVVVAGASLMGHKAAPAEHDLFDEIYARGRGVETSLKTVTAGFTETTTSSLLSRPLVARGTLVVERPSRIVLRYTDPEPRTVLIDHDQLTIAWPSRGVHQQSDIAAAQRRIEKYFLDKSPDELRRNFAITAQADDRTGTWRITMVPSRKQIQQGLVRLELWIDRTSMLLSAMRMTFPNADTKMMVFENVVVNGPIEPKVFTADPAASR